MGNDACVQALVNMAAAGDEHIPDSPQKGVNLSRKIELQQQDPIATQHEHLITEIEESTEGHLSTALRYAPLTAVKN